MRRRVAVGLVAVIALSTAALASIRSGGLTALAGAPGAAAPTPTTPRATAVVTRRTLEVRASLDGTIGYGDSFGVGGLSGILTWAPEEGSVVGRGEALYEVDGGPRTILLYGDRPAWRSMSAGMSDGDDVIQLQSNLKILGFLPASVPVTAHWSRATTAAVKRWQRAEGIPVDGRVDLGEVVFLPDAVRVASAQPLGSLLGATDTLQCTWDRQIVSVALDAGRRELLAAGTAVTVGMPDGTDTAGHVEAVGRVAHAAGTGSDPTIDVTIALDEGGPSDLDQAPVTVKVVTETRPDVLTVPVNALVALLEGGYALERVLPDGSTEYVGVQFGLFDSGWVEVTGSGIQAGDVVVVPS